MGIEVSDKGLRQEGPTPAAEPSRASSRGEAARASSPTRGEGDARRVRVLLVGPSVDILGGQAVQLERLLARFKDEPALEVGFVPVNPRLPGLLRKLQSVKYVRTVVTSLAYFALLLRRVPRFDVIHIFSASYTSFVIAPTPALFAAKLFGKKAVLNYRSGECED